MLATNTGFWGQCQSKTKQKNSYIWNYGLNTATCYLANQKLTHVLLPSHSTLQVAKDTDRLSASDRLKHKHYLAPNTFTDILKNSVILTVIYPNRTWHSDSVAQQLASTSHLVLMIRSSSWWMCVNRQLAGSNKFSYIELEAIKWETKQLWLPGLVLVTAASCWLCTATLATQWQSVVGGYYHSFLNKKKKDSRFKMNSLRITHLVHTAIKCARIKWFTFWLFG